MHSLILLYNLWCRPMPGAFKIKMTSFNYCNKVATSQPLNGRRAHASSGHVTLLSGCLVLIMVASCRYQPDKGTTPRLVAAR